MFSIIPSSSMFLSSGVRPSAPGITVAAILAALLLFATPAMGGERSGRLDQSDSLTSPVAGPQSHLRDANLKHHIDPMDVVRTVQGNRAEMFSGTQATAASKVANDIGSQFQIGTESAIEPAWLDQRSVAVASDGTGYLVIWSDRRIGKKISDIYAARVSKEGVVLDSCGIVVSRAYGQKNWPAVAFDGTNYVAVWEDGRNGADYDIYAARIKNSGEVLDTLGVAICTAAGSQYRPTIAFDGFNYMLAWQDERSGDLDIYGARVDQSLTVLDPEGIALCVSNGDQYYPEIAFGNGEYLLVWQDYRNASGWDIYGTRITTSGTVMDPAGIAILSGFSHQWAPDVAAGKNGFMVVWADGRATGSDTQSDIYGARVDVSGSVLDPGGIAVSTAPYMQHWPSIASDGEDYVVVWEDLRGESADIYASRVSANGSVIDPDGVLLSSAKDAQYYPAIAFNGTGLFVAWDDHRVSVEWNIFASRLTTSAGVLDPDGILISEVLNEQHWPAIAFDGTNYLVVWYDTWTGEADIYGARVDLLGNVLDPSGIIISSAPGHQTLPAVAFDGTNFLVVWEDSRSSTTWDIYGARVSTTGAVLDPSGIPISTASSHQFAPSLAFDGTNFLVVWTDSRSSGYEDFADIYGARVSKAGIVLDARGFGISTEPFMQHWPAVAFDGTDFVVVWQDTREDGYASHIYGARVTQSADVLDPDGILVTDAAVQQYLPSIAFDGTNYLLVWEDNRNGDWFDVYGARLTPSGDLLDPDGIAISTAGYHQLYPSVVFNGTSYLVAWMDLRGGVYYNLCAARVAASGAVLDPAGIPISPGTTHQLYPAECAANAGNALIAYSSFVPVAGTASSYRIMGSLCNVSNVGVDDDVTTPRVPSERVFLAQNSPNPFNPVTLLSFYLAEASSIRLSVFDITGKEVSVLWQGPAPSGWHNVAWDAAGLTSGVYFLRLDAREAVQIRKAVILK